MINHIDLGNIKEWLEHTQDGYEAQPEDPTGDGANHIELGRLIALVGKEIGIKILITPCSLGWRVHHVKPDAVAGETNPINQHFARYGHAARLAIKTQESLAARGFNSYIVESK